MKKNYWSDKQDNLLKTLLTNKENGNTKLYLSSYKALLPSLIYMTKGILGKYFKSIPIHRQEDLISSSISHLLLNGEYTNKRDKLYSYAGTIIRRFLYDETYKSDSWKKRSYNNHDNGIHIDDEDIILESPTNDEYDYNERELILNKINYIINSNLKLTTNKNKINILNISKEYFNKYFILGQVSALGLSDYINNNSNINSHTIFRIIHNIFNYYCDAVIVDNKEHIDYEKKYGRSYIINDLTPNDKKIIESLRVSKRKNNRDDYNYDYF